MVSKKLDKWVTGISYKNILSAAKVCGDTSVLEALFPEVFTSAEGKKLLENKETEAKKRSKKILKERGTSEKDSGGIKADGIILELTPNESRLLKTIINRHNGKENTGSPGMAAVGIWNKLRKVRYYDWNDHQVTQLPDTWNGLGELCKGEK